MPRIELTPEQKTLFIPLYAKALDYRSRHPILNDQKADELVRSIHFDFGSLRDAGSRQILAVRSRQLDEWTRGFLARWPDAVVLHLGCGLDARYFRVRPPPASSWFDIDFPDVIELRRTFYREEAGYRMLPASLTEAGWLAAIPRDRPGIGVADGVLEYLEPGEVSALVRRLVAQFPRGGLAFDVMGSGVIRRGNPRLRERVGARLHWSVDDLAEADALDPKLRRTAAVSLFATPYTPARYRLLYALLYLSKSFRQSIRLLRYEFP